MQKKKCIVITGASAGIGRATARAFAQQGASIGLLSRDQDRLKAVAEEIKALGGDAIYISTDIADYKAVENAAQIVEKRFGDIDTWINNAMVTVFGEVKDIEAEEFKRETEVTYLGTVYGTLAALKRMWDRNEGSIIQVGSALAYQAVPLQAAYCGSKHAVKGFTDSLRTEILHNNKNIHISMVQLPAHNTPQFSWSTTHVKEHPQPIPPIYQPEVAARAIVWAAEHKRREVWVGASSVATIILSKLIPEMIDRYLADTGYESQFAGKKLEKERKGNLYETVKGDYGAKGIFTNRSKKTSLQLELEKVPVLHYISNIIIAILFALTMGIEWMRRRSISARIIS